MTTKLWQFQPGQDHRNAKLSNEQVTEIRRRRLVDKELLKNIAADYGVGIVTIHRVATNRRYKDVPNPYPQLPWHHKTIKEQRVEKAS